MGNASTPIIHREKLFGGRATAEELHAKLAFHGAACDGCKSPHVSIRIQVFIRIVDMNPSERIAVEEGIRLGMIKPVKLATGMAIMYSRVHACRLCSPAAERAAARGPSYAIVDIMRSPGAEKPLVSVPGLIV
jgi:hypothetical protein